ncbi:hypothetical protein [Halobacillus dabanensis]|nr:hypothetical protein [Halobacillus dabanensis]
MNDETPVLLLLLIILIGPFTSGGLLFFISKNNNIIHGGICPSLFLFINDILFPSEFAKGEGVLDQYGLYIVFFTIGLVGAYITNKMK